MKKHIAIYGSTDLSGEKADFVRRLARSLLRQPDIVLVTGGFAHFYNVPGKISTDHAAVEGAKEFLEAEGIPVEERIETWLPEPERDRGRVVRFREGKVRELPGKSAQARRFSMVQNMDAIVTVQGRVQTAMVLDLALAINKPVLPLPFTDGDSSRYWQENKAQIQQWFDISDELATRMEGTELTQLPLEEQESLIEQIVNAVQVGVERRCLVLMPFDPELALFYEKVIHQAIRLEGFEPVKLDLTTYTGNILEIYLRRLDDCDAIIADVTEGNPNVMYELGHAHARGITPLLFSRRRLTGRVWEHLPFYLYEQKIEDFDAATAEGLAHFTGRIGTYLRGIRRPFRFGEM
jgi:hypothetical protein